MVLANVVRMGLEVSESQMEGGLHTPRSFFRQSSALSALGRTSHQARNNKKKEKQQSVYGSELIDFESSKHTKVSAITIHCTVDTSAVIIEK